MYLVDANVLLYAVDSTARDHRACSDWLEESLNGTARVGIPAQSVGAFLRISTHPRVMTSPLTGAEAWSIAAEWLAAPAAWIPEITNRTLAILGGLVVDHDVRGNLVTDAQLVASALEHGLTIVTMDSDFQRFPVLTVDPRERAN